MKTPAVPHLPRPPDITRASCPDDRARPINYLADYFWRRNLAFPFFSIFLDLYYGHCLFPDKTVDYGEITYDGTDLTINIEGTEYTRVWTSDEIEFSRLSGDNYILRRGDASTYEDCKTDYEDNPYWAVLESTSDARPMWGNEDRYPQTPRYRIIAWQFYLDYDTSSLSSVATAKLVFSVGQVIRMTTDEYPMVYIYEHDFGTLDTGDWTGGTKIAEREFTDDDEGTDVEISIDPSHVNPDGHSKFRITLKRIVELDYWPGPSDPTYYQHDPRCPTVKLVVTE